MLTANEMKFIGLDDQTTFRPTTRLMDLIVEYSDGQMSDEPMGEPQAFNSLEDFIEYNIEQLMEVDFAERDEIVSKLFAHEFSHRMNEYSKGEYVEIVVVI